MVPNSANILDIDKILLSTVLKCKLSNRPILGGILPLTDAFPVKSPSNNIYSADN